LMWRPGELVKPRELVGPRELVRPRAREAKSACEIGGQERMGKLLKWKAKQEYHYPSLYQKNMRNRKRVPWIPSQSHLQWLSLSFDVSESTVGFGSNILSSKANCIEAVQAANTWRPATRRVSMRNPAAQTHLNLK
jgi:hypothetical protein